MISRSVTPSVADASPGRERNVPVDRVVAQVLQVIVPHGADYRGGIGGRPGESGVAGAGWRGRRRAASCIALAARAGTQPQCPRAVFEPVQPKFTPTTVDRLTGTASRPAWPRHSASRLPPHAFTTHPILVYHPSSPRSAEESGKLMGSRGQNVLLA